MTIFYRFLFSFFPRFFFFVFFFVFVFVVFFCRFCRALRKKKKTAKGVHAKKVDKRMDTEVQCCGFLVGSQWSADATGTGVVELAGEWSMPAMWKKKDVRLTGRMGALRIRQRRLAIRRDVSSKRAQASNGSHGNADLRCCCGRDGQVMMGRHRACWKVVVKDTARRPRSVVLHE